ncbi:MAG: DNA topoisomerase I, partial [Candidatus Bathyarchaeia archaeon]
MDFTFILTEKLDAASKIAYALDDSGSPRRLSKEGVPYFEASNQGRVLRIVPTNGHLYTIAAKRKSDYPIFELGWTPNYKTKRNLSRSRKWIKTIAALSSGASEYVSATDCDIEGELIGYTVLRFACRGHDRDASRMVFSTLTTKELREAFLNRQPHLDYRRIDAGEVRHILDFLWGINVSRALTYALRNSDYAGVNLSAGRVQGPTLGFVVKKDSLIEGFTPSRYWIVYATIECDGRLYRAEHCQTRFNSHSEAQQVVARLNVSNAFVNTVTTKTLQRSPPPPFNLGSLQSEAYRFFGYSPSKTLQIAESLYLDALISYPRTESERIPITIDYKKILSSLVTLKTYSPLIQPILEQGSFNPTQGKDEDPTHPAIYPTGIIPKKELNQHKARIYDLIVRRFISAFCQPAILQSTHISLEINGETFYLDGRNLLSNGWLSLYQPYIKEKESAAFNLKEGQNIPVRNIFLIEKQTEPPKRYNTISLLQKMKNEKIGTETTRATIIDILFERRYVKGERIESTSLGRGIYEALQSYCPDLVSVDLTRQLEKDIMSIQKGAITKEQVIEEATKILKEIFENFKKNEKAISLMLLHAVEKENIKRRIIGICPICNKGSLLIVRNRKTGKVFAGCSRFSEGLCNAA